MNESLTLLTYQDVADRLKVSDRTVYSWVKAGRLKAVKLGTHRNSPARVDPRDLQSFIDQIRGQGGEHE